MSYVNVCSINRTSNELKLVAINGTQKLKYGIIYYIIFSLHGALLGAYKLCSSRCYTNTDHIASACDCDMEGGAETVMSSDLLIGCQASCEPVTYLCH